MNDAFGFGKQTVFVQAGIFFRIDEVIQTRRDRLRELLVGMVGENGRVHPAEDAVLPERAAQPTAVDFSVFRLKRRAAAVPTQIHFDAVFLEHVQKFVEIIHFDGIEIQVGAVVIERFGIVIIIAALVHFGIETDTHALQLHFFQRVDLHLPVRIVQPVLLFHDTGVELRAETLRLSAVALLYVQARIPLFDDGHRILLFIAAVAASCRTEYERCRERQTKTRFERLHLITSPSCAR